MKAVMKTAPGVGNVEVREIAEPSTPPRHVKIAVQAAGICGTDLHIYYDEYRSWPPVVLGHEVAGCVAEVGSGVERIRRGDRVTTETYFYTCGACHFCRAGRINLCPERRSIGSAVHGGFTSHLVVPERNVHVLPDGLSYLAGALTEPLACVVHGALELPRVVPADLAVVAGPGAIGLLTAQTIKAAGARAGVLGTDADEPRLRLAVGLDARPQAAGRWAGQDRAARLGRLPAHRMARRLRRVREEERPQDGATTSRMSKHEDPLRRGMVQTLRH